MDREKAESYIDPQAKAAIEEHRAFYLKARDATPDPEQKFHFQFMADVGAAMTLCIYQGGLGMNGMALYSAVVNALAKMHAETMKNCFSIPDLENVDWRTLGIDYGDMVRQSVTHSQPGMTITIGQG